MGYLMHPIWVCKLIMVLPASFKPHRFEFAPVVSYSNKRIQCPPDVILYYCSTCKTPVLPLPVYQVLVTC